MGKIDSIKEKINILRDDHKNMFIFFMTILTGSFTVFYQVVIVKLSVMYAFIGVIGLLVALVIIYKMKMLKINIDILINELEDIE